MYIWPPVTLGFCLCTSLLVCRWCSTLPCMLWDELCGSRLGCFSCTKTLGMVHANPHHTVFVFRRTTPPKCTGALPLCSSEGIYFLLVTMRVIRDLISMSFFLTD